MLTRTLPPLLMAWTLMTGGTAQAQAWAWWDDVLPLLGFRSFAHAMRGRGYKPFRNVPADRSDDELNDRGGGDISAIRHIYAELVSCSGTELNACIFLFARPGRWVVEVDTTGQDPAHLIIVSIERLNREQAEAVFRSECDLGPTPDTPCPR